MEHFDWTLGFWAPYTNFLIFITLAVVFFRKPLSAMAKKRREDYLSAFKEAVEAKKLAESRLRELELRLAGLDNEIQTIKNNAELEANREAEKIIDSANKLAEHLKSEASRIVETEISNAKSMLKKEILAQVQKSVEVKLKSEFSEDQQRLYVDKHLPDINQLSLRV
ncbi:MAG: ATP synthase F0 subunit B [Bdellovibrionota bacterium]